MSKILKTVVTGAASGIGRAIAKELENRGDKLIGVDRYDSPGILGYDLADQSSRTTVIDKCLEILGTIDVLVNVAGVFIPTPITNSTLEQWRKVWQVDLEAPIELMSLALPGMLDSGFGRIVNITSVHARYGQPNCLAYDVAKAGLEAASRSAALVGADRDVLVNSVAPGFVKTAMSRNEDGIDETDTPEFITQYRESGLLPIRRSAQPAEIANSVLWLTSRQNTYLTGQVITVDGGLTSRF
jgi:NAD(P)-dependent dehydrogenase (short-subunit alcohol dehydrogenase family)